MWRGCRAVRQGGWRRPADSLPRVSFGQGSLRGGGTGPLGGVIDHRLARQHLINEYRKGRLARHQVCDAHPELIRAARNVGERARGKCPVCAGRELYYVSYVYGDGLKHANGRCLSYPGELEKLRAKHDEFDRYVVEVCTDCRWNHLGARELHGRRHAG